MRKYTKMIGIMVIVIAVIMIGRPVFHLYKTKFKESPSTVRLPSGYTNDASELNLTKVDTIIAIAETKSCMEEQLKALIKIAKARKIPISIAGAKHSMGGHTMYPNGILINMLPYNHIEVDLKSNTVTAGAGALWEDVIKELDKHGKSVKVMQAFSSFSVGGSISVNGHGWQKNAPPIGSTVRSLRILNAEGDIIQCSDEEHTELFKLIIGGYGLFGIILEATLDIVDNSVLQFKRHEMKTSEYLAYFKKYALNNPEVELVFGRLNISHQKFLEKATLNTFERKHFVTDVSDNKTYQSIPTEMKRIVFRSTVNSEYGKKLRWNLESIMGSIGNEQMFTRNQLLNDHVSLIKNKDSTSVDILQEYFIPERNFEDYIQDLKQLLPHQDIDLLNITIRDVQKDETSFLNYAREHVFGFVFLFNQQKTAKHEEQMTALTQCLTELAIKHEGTFYLPYRLHNTPETMRKAYPQTDDFFELKLKYDPNQLFRNKFYDHYQSSEGKIE